MDLGCSCVSPSGFSQGLKPGGGSWVTPIPGSGWIRPFVHSLGFYPGLFVGSRPPVYKTSAWNKWKFVGPPPQSWILFLKGISWLICAAKTPRCQLLGSAKGVQIPVEQHRAGCPPIATGKHPPASLTLFLGSFLAFLQGFFQGPILLGATARPSHVPLWKEGEKGK